MLETKCLGDWFDMLMTDLCYIGLCCIGKVTIKKRHQDRKSVFNISKLYKIFCALLNRTSWFRWIFQILKILKFSKIFWYVDITGIFWDFGTGWFFWHFGTPRTKKSRMFKNFSKILVRDQTFTITNSLYLCCQCQLVTNITATVIVMLLN